MNKLLLFTFLLLAFSSCMGDAEKELSTNLQFEGQEIFNISLSLDESLFYVLQPISYYNVTESNSIPGCPEVAVDGETNKVSLTFSPTTDCPIDSLLIRFGTIHLQYPINPLLKSTVTMTYEDYMVDGINIEGKREFDRAGNLNNPNLYFESFTDLLLINAANSSTKISGDFTYQLRFLLGNPVDITSVGQITGRNTAGRRISMQQVNPNVSDFNCLKVGNILPKQGRQQWEIFRSGNNATRHSLIFGLDEVCKSNATVNLADGRVMVFRVGE